MSQASCLGLDEGTRDILAARNRVLCGLLCKRVLEKVQVSMRDKKTEGVRFCVQNYWEYTFFNGYYLAA